MAHSLARLPNRPPITLLLHDLKVYEDWKEHGRRIAIFRNGLAESSSGFDINVLKDSIWHSLPDGETKLNKYRRKKPKNSDNWDDEQIDSLIVTVKASQAIMALKSVKHRLTPDSTVLFLQNGMGTIEEANELVFPDPETRPHYLAGITSHALYRLKSYNIIHAGMGTTSIGFPNPKTLPQGTQTDIAGSDPESVSAGHDEPATSRYLLDTLTRIPALTAVKLNSSSLLQARFEKLAVNCVINPLTVLLDCYNGELLYNYYVSRTMRLLLIEISAVICAMPELQGVPNVQARFAPERLRTLVAGVASRTKSNKSSMLQDVNSHKETEIQYLNGYIVRKGDELGIKCALNYMMTQLIMAKSKHLRSISASGVQVDLSALSEFDESLG